MARQHEPWRARTDRDGDIRSAGRSVSKSWRQCGILWFITVMLIALGCLRAEPVVAQEARSSLPPVLNDLSSRFRFRQFFVDVRGDRSDPRGTSLYQVAIRTQDEVVDQIDEDDEPRRSIGRSRVLYREQPIRVQSNGEIALAVRRYDTAIFEGEASRILPKPFLDELQIWYQTRRLQPPLIVTMNPSRKIRYEEFRTINNHPLVSVYSGLLSSQAVSVGDSWILGLDVAQSLVARPILPTQGTFNVTFLELRGSKNSRERVAIFQVQGRTTALDQTSIAFNCRFQLAFRLQEFAGRDDRDRVVDAAGLIRRLRSARVESSLVYDEQNRPQNRTVTRRFDLACRPVRGQSSLSILTERPELTPENTWLDYVDPAKEFRLSFPQSYSVETRARSDLPIVLTRLNDERQERIIFRPQRDVELDAQEIREKAREVLDRPEIDLRPGAIQRISSQDWPLRPRVEWFEFVSRPVQPPLGFPDLRLFVDGYVIAYRDGNALYAESITAQNPPEAFRDEVRQILQTFRILRRESVLGDSTTATRDQAETP